MCKILSEYISEFFDKVEKSLTVYLLSYVINYHCKFSISKPKNIDLKTRYLLTSFIGYKINVMFFEISKYREHC